MAHDVDDPGRIWNRGMVRRWVGWVLSQSNLVMSEDLVQRRPAELCARLLERFP
jgi:hypothetical protein